MSANYLESLFSLGGKTAVVIGGTGELCGAMAEGLAAAGAEVVLVGRSEEKANARLARIHAAGGQAYFESCEVDSKANLDDLLAQGSRQIEPDRISSSMEPAPTAPRLFWRSQKKNSTGFLASI